MKPLDFVKTPKGAIAIVLEINDKDWGSGTAVSISFLGGGNPSQEKNAWWDASELEVIDNLPSLLARNVIHPFGAGKEPALRFYPIKAGYQRLHPTPILCDEGCGKVAEFHRCWDHIT